MIHAILLYVSRFTILFKIWESERGCMRLHVTRQCCYVIAQTDILLLSTFKNTISVYMKCQLNNDQILKEWCGCQLVSFSFRVRTSLVIEPLVLAVISTASLSFQLTSTDSLQRGFEMAISMIQWLWPWFSWWEEATRWLEEGQNEGETRQNANSTIT